MNKSESIQELAKALCAFQQEISGVAKNAKNPFYNSKYADLGAIWQTIREPLTKNGLSIIQLPGTTAPELITIETILLHVSGEWISETFSQALVTKEKSGSMRLQNDPQSAGSAITYARRYALAAVLGIHQADDDAHTYNHMGDEHSVKPKPSTPAPTPEPDTAHVLQVAISGTLKSLIDGNVDNYSVKTHRDASILKHLGTKTVKECRDTNLLESYLQHLTEKLPTTQAELEVVNE